MLVPGFRPSMDDNVEVDDTSDSDDEGVMPFTRRRKKLIRKMKAKNRWKKASNQRQWVGDFLPGLPRL